MKSRELTAAEAGITITIEDIKKIKGNTSKSNIYNKQAIEALTTGLSVREREMNIFVSGPTRSERIRFIQAYTKNINKNQRLSHCSKNSHEWRI